MDYDDDPKEEAVPFLIYDLNKKAFTLTEQGEEVIRSLPDEFGVIAVAGMYRTGKSYLLNRMLLNRQKGFSIGPTVNPCTKGLWIWSRPIYGNSQGGKRLPMLLIDTEGFGALDEDSNHDIRIFTLSILLSSFFIYNSLGSIDENALQNLSFVINLSKFIHMKREDYESDPEELSNMFPSFLWVVRDFTLQLIDENDESITPKEYLEKVLEGTKKSAHDPKNKIRKLIKTYFKDRDCFTMVRPLTNENQLQSLESLSPDKLRPEFLEQILQLRKKILSHVKVKTMNGKALNSEMYLGLIKNLVSAINSGSIPNIENTWMSMCRVESYKAFEEAERIYETYLKENVGTSDDTLEQIHKDAKDKAMEAFKRRAIGDAANEYVKQLKSKIKEKYSYYNNLQDEEMKLKIQRILNKWYSILETRIQNNEFKSIDEIANNFSTLENKLNETFSNYNGRNELFNEFKTKVFAYAGEYFASRAESEKRFLQEQSNQQLLKLTNDLDNMKANYEKEDEKKKALISQNQNEISELKELTEQLKESLAVSEKEKEIIANNFNSQLSRMKEDFDRRINEAETKSYSNEENLKDAERRVITIKAECDKEKALLNQKVDLLSKQIDDYSKREKETSQEMKSQLKEQSIAYKDKMEKYEKTIKSLSIENDNYKEKVIDLESNLQNSEILYQNEKKNYEELEEKNAREIKELNDKYQILKKNSNDEREKLIRDYKQRENDLTTEIQRMKLRVDEIETEKKNADDTSRANASKMERENAILKQENSLLKTQNKELTNRINDQKQYYENIISNLESKAFSVDHEEFQKKIDEVKAYYEDEKKKSEEEYNKSKNSLSAQIDKLTENYNKSELNAKSLQEEMDDLTSQAKIKIDKLTKENNELLNKTKQLNELLNSNSTEMNSKLKQSRDELEKTLEEKEALHQKEIVELNASSEETLNQLKALFETEKTRLEEKLKEEKAKNEKKITSMIEDYENKIKDQEMELKEENENLQNELNDLEKAHYTYVTNMEHEIEMRNQKIESMDAAVKDAKESLATTLEQKKNDIDQLNEQLNKDRKDYQNKIDSITNDLNEREREIAGFKSKKEQIDRILNEKDALIAQIRNEYTRDKDEITEKYEKLRKEFNELNDNSMMRNLQSTRDNALLNQQIEFLNKKNEEQLKITEQNQKRYVDRLFAQRTEIEKDLQDKFERLKNEKKELEGKLLTKKKEIKEIEQTFTKQIQLITKEKNDISEKYTSLQKNYDELNENYQNDKSSNEKQINILTQENNSFKENLNYSEKAMKNRIANLENELMEKTAQYEKDQILWEGKIKFIEQQRDTLKKDKIESNKRFENLLDTIQKKGNAEKEKIESATQNVIANLEEKYQRQIKDLNDNHNKLLSELINNNKELERELKSVTLENELNKNKNFNPADLVRKLDEITKEREKLKQNETKLKAQQEAKVGELLENFDKEKEILKKKINEMEKGLREAEGKRGAILLELEKEKAKWAIEKDNLTNKVTEANDKMDMLERKNENLLRENEKLKNERNLLKKSNMQNNSKYSLMYRDQGSMLNNSNLLKKDSTQGNSRYMGSLQQQTYKTLGDMDGNNNDRKKYEQGIVNTQGNEEKKKILKQKTKVEQK